MQNESLRLWRQLGKTIVFVTHSIDEALYLADWVVVMTYRPSTIKRNMDVTLRLPHDSSAADFNALKRDLTKLVMEELQAERQQRKFASGASRNARKG